MADTKFCKMITDRGAGHVTETYPDDKYSGLDFLASACYKNKSFPFISAECWESDKPEGPWKKCWRIEF